MSGICAGIAAARGGARVALLQDRAVLGGNASSEIRMWICGAHGADNKETGILEELLQHNIYRNPRLNYSIWDGVLHDTVANEPNLDLYLSTAVTDVEMHESDSSRIAAVRAWHLTRQCWLHFHAQQFIDCSGDSILRYSGAEYRWGREAKHEYSESLGQDTADRCTMGNSILLQLRAIDPEDHIPFIPPTWAEAVDEDKLPGRPMKPTGHNFWFRNRRRSRHHRRCRYHPRSLISHGLWCLGLH